MTANALVTNSTRRAVVLRFRIIPSSLSGIRCVVPRQASGTGGYRAGELPSVGRIRRTVWGSTGGGLWEEFPPCPPGLSNSILGSRPLVHGTRAKRRYCRFLA